MIQYHHVFFLLKWAYVQCPVCLPPRLPHQSHQPSHWHPWRWGDVYSIDQPSLKLTLPLKIGHPKRIVFQTSIFRRRVAAMISLIYLHTNIYIYIYDIYISHMLFENGGWAKLLSTKMKRYRNDLYTKIYIHIPPYMLLFWFHGFSQAVVVIWHVSDQALNSFMEFLNTGRGRATEKIHVHLVFFFSESQMDQVKQIIDSGAQWRPYSTLLQTML